MPRCGRIRSYIRDCSESPNFEKISFIPPFLILAIEIILIIHAISINEIFDVLLTTVLLIISIIEIFLVSGEVHEHYQKSNFDRILTIRLDDYITEKNEKNVKTLISDFLEEYPNYESQRGKIYHIICQILETHEEEIIEKEISEKINKFIKKNKKESVDEILEDFIKIYPKYKKFRIKIYEKICQILGEKQE